MSKLNAIEAKLEKIDQAAIHELGDTYFYKCGYTKLTPWGSVAGQDKERPGVPDSYIELENGNYIFIEYTAQKSKVYRKFETDLKKDLDKNRIGIPIEKIEKIFVFYNSKLNVSEVDKLRTISESKGILFENYNISRISLDLLYKFPSIAKDFLSISVDTKQILSLEEFVKEASNRPFTPGFDNKFLFREKEIQQIIDSLSNNIVTIIQGKAGVGKTRVSIEACSKFIETNKDYDLKFIDDKNREIYDDLVTYFCESDEKFIIFLDDANRQSAIDQIFQITKDNHNKIKLIITVRDYAFKSTMKKLEQYFKQYQPLSISEFTHSEIKAILNELNITNPLWIDRIWELSKGNVRIALMAANVRKKLDHISILANIEDIYEKYYESISKDLSEINLTVLGIISFFRIIDLKDTELMTSIENNFSINGNDFIENSMTLHQQELVDMWEDEIVKISDQVLQTYIFYKSFIKDKLLDFSIILNVYYDAKYREKIKDLVYSSLSAFDFRTTKNQLIPYLNKKLDSIKNDKNELITYYDLFWLLKPTETLEFINDEIRKLPTNDRQYDGEMKSESVKDIYINILTKFMNTSEENFKISIQLLFEYIQRIPDIVPQVLHYVEHDISFKRFSYNLHYKQQLIFIKFVYEDLNSVSTLDAVRLFVASHFSKLIFEDNWMTSKHQFTWTNFPVLLRPKIKEIRKLIWEFLHQTFKHAEDSDYILTILDNYINQIRFKSTAEADSDVVKYDSNFVLKLINDLDNNELRNCILVHNYFEALSERKIEVKESDSIRENFSTKLFELYQLFTKTFWELKNHKESEKKKKGLLLSYVENFHYDDFIQLLEDYYSLQQQKLNAWDTTESLKIILRYLFETDFNMFFKLIEYLIIQKNNFIQLQPYFFITDLINDEKISHKEFYDFIKDYDYDLKDEWIINFFQVLPNDKITKGYYNELIAYLKSFDQPYLDMRLDFLEKYKPFNEKIYIEVIKILYEKTFAGINVNFQFLFNNYTDIFKRIPEIFKDNFDLLKKVYLYQRGKDQYTDHKSEVLRMILEKDPNFIIVYLDWMHKKKDYLSDMSEHNDYSSLWKAPNYEKIFDKILKYFSKDPDFFFASHHYINVFFRKHENDGITVRLDYLKRKFNESLNDVKMIKLLFVIITNNYSTERLHLISAFTQKNNDIEIFRQLYLEPDSMFGGATFVPIYLERIKFWESVKDSFSSAEFLKHRRYTEEKIQYYRRRIKDDQRRNFSDDF